MCEALSVFAKKGQRAVDVVEVRVVISPIQEGGLQRNFCFQEPVERRTLCPCYRAYKACCNTIGKRPESSHKSRQNMQNKGEHQ